MSKTTVYDAVVKCLKDVYEVYRERILCILIFGSLARNDLKITSSGPSDVDIFIIFKDNVPVNDVLRHLDTLLSSRKITYDCGWCRISDLEMALKEGEDWFLLYNILNFGVLICGDPRIVNELRNQTLRINPVEAIYKTLQIRLHENITLKHAIIRNFRTLLLNIALLDFLRVRKHIPTYSELLNWALSKESTLNEKEKEALRKIVHMIHSRQRDVNFSTMDSIEQLIIKRVKSLTRAHEHDTHSIYACA